MAVQRRSQAMSDGRKAKLKEAAEAVHLPNMGPDVPSEAKSVPDMPLSPEQSYLKRKAEVTQQDHEEFSEYLQKKIARDRLQKLHPADAPERPPSKLDRRSLLTW